VLLAGCVFGGGAGPSSRRDAAVDRGFRRLEAGEWSHAMGAFHEALDIDSNSAPARYGLGRVFGETGYLDGAEREFLRAVRIRPDYGEAYLGLAALYDRTGRRDDAERNLREAKRHGAADSPEGLLLAGRDAMREGRLAEAERLFREGIGISPADVNLRFALVDLLREQGRHEEALREVERERFPRGSEDAVRARLADCRLHLGQDLEAEKLYRQIAAADPSNRDALEGLMLLSLRRGDIGSAKENLEALAALLPGTEAHSLRSLAAVLDAPDPFYAFLLRCREARASADESLAGLLDRWIRELESRSP